MGKVPSDERVDELLTKIGVGLPDMNRIGGLRHEAQQILWVEDACREIIDIVDRMKAIKVDEGLDPFEPEPENDDDPFDLVYEFKSQTHFLKTIISDRAFLRTLGNMDRP